MSRKLYLGEKRYVGMTVSRADGEAFTVATAAYTVVNSAGVTVETGDATIDGAEVFFLFDTTATAGTPPVALYAAGRSYKAWFSVTITDLSKVIRDCVLVEVA